MALHKADEFLQLLDMERILWIQGHFGSHKTSFAVYLGLHFAKKGYAFVSPFSCILNEFPFPVYKGPKVGVRAVVVLDEGGLWFRTREDVDVFGAYLRKLDIYVLLPSKTEPHESFQKLTVQPVFPLDKYGIPLITYKYWQGHGGQGADGAFVWSRPAEVYDLFDSADPSGEGLMSDLLRCWVADMQDHYGQVSSVGIDFGTKEGRLNALELEQQEERRRERDVAINREHRRAGPANRYRNR